jgi:hypothetical protein
MWEAISKMVNWLLFWQLVSNAVATFLSRSVYRTANAHYGTLWDRINGIGKMRRED